MTDKELRKLGRADLLEMLLELTRQNEALRGELEAARAEKEKREIQISQAGSIAEAALQLNGVFEAAQAAAEQYLENIKRLQPETQGEAHGKEDRA